MKTLRPFFCVAIVMAVVAVATEAMLDYAMEGETYSLSCFSTNGSSNAQVLYWLINGEGEAYEPGNSYESVSVDANGDLMFKEVSVDHEGGHLCVTKLEEKVAGHFVHMRVRPLPPSDPWNEVYKGQFITGLVAALVCAFMFTAGCLVFKYRYKEPKAVLLNGEEAGHTNPAMEAEEGRGEGHSTKM